MTATEALPTELTEEQLSPLHVIARGGVDVGRATLAITDLLVALGRDPRSDALADTPRRVIAALAESLTPQPFEMTTFANDEKYDEMVLVRDIPFHSLCAHHMLPFIGMAHVAYVPEERIVGLSKLARVVDHFSRDLQTQERLTNDVADALQVRARPRGVGVAIEATHLCMTLRGVNASGARTTTMAVRGVLRDDPARRLEFARLTSSPARCTT